MLSQLHIENIAVIDKVDIQFDNGLNVLTGETGAGKSIIIDSINIILGERASRDLIRSGKNKAVVQALFDIDCKRIRNALEQMGIYLDDGNVILISREITSSGRNICRVNGNIVTLSILKDIGKLLVNIHGQHDNQALLEWENHIDFLDKYAGDKFINLKNKYTRIFNEVKNIRAQITKISVDEREKERKIDLLKFQIDEIDNAKLKNGEEDKLEKSHLLQSNVEKIMKTVTSVYNNLYEGATNTPSIHDNLSSILYNLETVSSLDNKLNDFYKAFEAISYQLDELAYDIRDYRDNLEFDPALLNEIEERIDLIYKLKRKYGSSVEEILEYREKIEKEFNNMTTSEEKLNVLNKELECNLKEMKSIANILSQKRKEVARKLQEKIMNELKDLDMKRVRFKVQIDKVYSNSSNIKFNANGFDRIEFLISTNPGEPLKPLSKIASGGELSRIMLAMKNVLADVDDVETLIFDEIDTGVSGRAAQKIAEKLSFIVKKKQVLCITHIPQIASMADHHYEIIKEVKGDKSYTSVNKLDMPSRTKELARIIGGAFITDLTLKHAEEMLNIAEQIKKRVVNNE